MITHESGVSAQGTAAGTISLLLGHPDPTTLLTPEMRDAVQGTLTNSQSYAAFQYSPEQGTRSLIAFLVEKINREQGLALGPENVMLVAGSTHAVDMITRLYAKPRVDSGSVILIEAPTYADSIHIFRDHRVELRGISMDENGLIIADLEHELERLRAEGKSPSFVYTIPNFHNPTGITLASDRRAELIRLARAYGFWIVEDDVYRDLCFEDSIPDSLYAMANGQQILSIGSFSKTLAPGLRLGWLVGPADAIKEFVNCGTTQMGGGASPFTANVVAEYCRKGYLGPHISNLRALYQQRRDAALAALSTHMPAGVTWTHPRGGFFIWLTLPDNVDAREVKQAAVQRGVMVAAGNGYYIEAADGDHHLRLAFSFAPLADIEKAIQVLGSVIRDLTSAR